MRTPLLILLCLTLTLTNGCKSPLRKIGPLQIESVERLGSSGLELVVLLPNQSRRTWSIEQAEIAIYDNGQLLLQAELRGTAVVVKRSENRLKTRWRLRSEDPTALLQLERRLKEEACDQLSVDYRIAVKSGPVRKTFSAEKVALQKILSTFVPIE